MISPVNSFLTDVVHCCNYRLINRDQTNNDSIAQRISKMLKKMEARMRNHQVFDASNLISILSLSKKFKTACDSNEISEDAILRLIHCFMKKPWNTAVFSRLQLRTARSSKLNKNDGSLFVYRELVSHLLATYATDDVSNRTDSDIH